MEHNIPSDGERCPCRSSNMHHHSLHASFSSGRSESSPDHHPDAHPGPHEPSRSQASHEMTFQAHTLMSLSNGP